MKKITLNVEGITPKQWTNFVLELNIMKKAWRPYGVDVKEICDKIKEEFNVKKIEYKYLNRETGLVDI